MAEHRKFPLWFRTLMGQHLNPILLGQHKADDAEFGTLWHAVVLQSQIVKGTTSLAVALRSKTDTSRLPTGAGHGKWVSCMIDGIDIVAVTHTRLYLTFSAHAPGCL